MIDYTLIIAILAFFAAIQLVAKLNASPLISALVAVGVPLAVNLALKYVFLVGNNLPLLDNLLSVQLGVTVVLQFITAMIIFRRLRDNESIESWIGWGVGGAIVVIILLPLVVSKTIT